LRLDNAFVFPEYLLRAFQHFVTSTEKREKPGPWVRATYASCLGSLASTASHFLDIVQTEPSNDSTISDSQYQNLYDVARQDLIEQFEMHTKALLTDKDPSVRRALLPSVSTLCVFFGKAKASYVILGYLNTYINNGDWMLKNAFFEAIVGVATYMGTAVLEEFILPLMVQALTDPEESVVERVIRSFSAIAKLGIFQPSTVWELVDTVARFTMHPDISIREAATEFIVASAKFASPADQACIITPLIRDYVRVEPAELSEPYLLDSLKKPLPRAVLDMAALWSVKTDRSLFWKTAQQDKIFSFGFGQNVSLPPKKGSGYKTFARVPRTEEDDNWIEKLRRVEMKTGDEFKLLALQEYIWRTSHRRLHEDIQKPKDGFSGIVKLNDKGLSLQTIIFENKKTAERGAYDSEQARESRTIADALHDATTTELASADAASATNRPTPIPVRSPSGNDTESLQSPTKRSGSGAFQEPSSLDSKRSLKVPDLPIHRKGSAMNLMGLKESTSKASAADASTDVTHAIGKMERSHSRDDEVKRKPSYGSGRRVKPVHTYSGHDPNVLRLLDSLYLENYPIELIEFGQVLPPLNREPLRRGGVNPHRGLWQPEGVLIAMLGEHKAGINRVVVSPDHKFFITGSDDGTVKVWDTGRLERTVHHRARNTHVQGTNVRVTSLTFVEKSHCFISTGSDGSVHLVKVDCSEKSTPPGGPLQYGKLHMIREYQLPEGEFAVWSEHHKSETQHHKLDGQSLMILATNKSNIYAIDLRTMEVAFEFKNPVNHGTPTCFCVDRRGHWLVLGTSHGVLDLWDLRFNLRVRSWAFPQGLPIYHIMPPMLRGSKKVRVTIAGGAPGTITALDIEKSVIREVYKASIHTPSLNTEPSSSSTPSTPKKGNHHQSPIPTLIDLDEKDPSTSGGFLARFSQSALSTDTSSTSASTLNQPPDLAVRALAMGAHILDENSDPRHAFIVAAGPDWKIRFWDALRADSCCVVSGGNGDGADAGEPKTVFAVQNTGETVVVVEKDVPSPINSKAAVEAMATPESSRGGGGSKKDGKDKEKSSGKKGSIVSLQQQILLRGHKDAITDVAVVEIPYGMVISVDRAGMIYVWC
jgi:phosphoinositide-3-kinase, regulatory subunit 4